MKLSTTLEKLAGSPFQQSLWIMGLALVPRLLYVWLIPADLAHGEDPWYFLQIAQNLLAGEGFREFHLLAYRPPMFPFLIAGVFSVFGHSIVAVQLVQVVLFSWMCVLISRVGALLNAPRAGLAAGLYCAVHPMLIHYSVQLWSDQLFAFLLAASLVAFLHAERNTSDGWAAVSGVLLGAASLTREAGLVVLAGLLLWLCVTHKNLRVGLRRWLPVAVCTVLVVLPWTLRNYHVFGRIVPIATNGGVNFYMGNNPEANGTYRWATAPGVEWNQPSPHGEKELQANLEGYRAGLAFIRDNPVRFVQLIGLRLYYLFRPPIAQLSAEESLVETGSKVVWLIMYGFAFAITLFVGPFLVPRMPQSLGFLYALMAMLSLPHAVTYGATRYRLPMEPLIALIAAIVLFHLMDQKRTAGRGAS